MTRKEQIISEAKEIIKTREDYVSALPKLEATDESYFESEPTWDADYFLFANMDLEY